MVNLKLRLGIDLDGVLADFTTGYKNRLFVASGERKISLDEEPPCWNWALEVGYTPEQDKQAWDEIKRSADFWANLGPLPQAREALQQFHEARALGQEVYFITDRPGVATHLQSQFWLDQMGMPMATVLMARSIKQEDGSYYFTKGDIARGLQLTHFIDDRPENVFDVKEKSPATDVFLLLKRYNLYAQEECEKRGIKTVSSLFAFLEEVGEYAKS